MKKKKRLIALICISGLLIAGQIIAKKLHDAARDGDLAQVEKLVEQGEDVNSKDQNKFTPLHKAAQ